MFTWRENLDLSFLGYDIQQTHRLFINISEESAGLCFVQITICRIM